MMTEHNIVTAALLICLPRVRTLATGRVPSYPVSHPSSDPDTIAKLCVLDESKHREVVGDRMSHPKHTTILVASVSSPHSKPPPEETDTSINEEGVSSNEISIHHPSIRSGNIRQKEKVKIAAAAIHSFKYANVSHVWTQKIHDC